MNSKEYFKHLSIVIFGILIAFWINNIGLNYKERTTQKKVFLTILNEIKDNNKNIKASIQNLDTLRTTFTGIKNGNNSSSNVSISYLEIDVTNIGYETAKYIGVLKDVNYKLVSEIVEDYESQNTLKELEKLMMDEIYIILKNKVAKKDNLDYLLLQISNLIHNLEIYDYEQKQLIENLMIFLKK